MENERRLSAIMFTDMVGYTALGQRNESLSLALVDEQRKLIRPILGRHRGREVKTIGDAFLVEFPNAVDAVRCAYDIQRAVREFNFSLEEEKRIHLRVGVHVGEVVESQGDISGDAVNVASRIEPLAEVGGVCITHRVYDLVHTQLDLRLTPLGPKSLKNVERPMEVYRVVMPWEDAAATTSPTVGAGASTFDKKRVAVLPFTNMSSDPEEGYFADGMTEEIITSLSCVKQLMVIARTSIMKYKDSKKGVSEVARELNVGTLLEGSVRKAGGRVRITAQLIDAANEAHLWAQNYDRTVEDVFAIQSEIAEKVAGELKVLLVGSERRAIEKKPTENAEAHSAYLRGRELLRQGGEAPIRQALDLFGRAVELDPGFARAHVGIAECHQGLANEGAESWEVMLPVVKATLKRALALDPDLPEAHATFSWLLFNEDDLPGAEAEARRSVELNPSLPEPYQILFEVAFSKGDTEEGVGMAEAAYRLDPIMARYIGVVGTAYLWTGREQEFLRHWEKAEPLAPMQYCSSMMDYHLGRGDIGKAREMFARYEKLRPNALYAATYSGFIDAMEGNRGKALEAMRKIEESGAGPITYNNVAYIYFGLGDFDKYFEYLNRALEAHTLQATTVMYYPALARTREDPRYQALLEKARKLWGLAK